MACRMSEDLDQKYRQPKGEAGDGRAAKSAINWLDR